jgi:mono/diheme cytochrome c family protein
MKEKNMHAGKQVQRIRWAAWLILMCLCTAASAADYAFTQRGQYLAKAADCAACHGDNFAGGVAIPTPFGSIYSTNITPDKETGIGNWSTEDFYRAMHDGITYDGEHLYPAMPYPWYTRMTRDDVNAIKAYLDTLEPVKQENKPTQLPWPFGWRGALAVWNKMYFEPGELKTDPKKSAQWNRGAYLVEGPGHCSACHTPKNMLGADKKNASFSGADSGEHWYAPNLTGDLREGLGRWSAKDIVEYLKTGSNAHSAASGQMADVIKDSTQYLSDDDLNAIAAYLMDMPIRKSERQAFNIDGRRMMRGAALYFDNCTACHLQNGEGQQGVFPSLRNSSVVQAQQPDTLVHLVIEGGKRPATSVKPTVFAMPGFSTKLSDDDIADLLTYLRNTWGNQASPVDAGKVKELRKGLTHGESG